MSKPHRYSKTDTSFLPKGLKPKSEGSKTEVSKPDFSKYKPFRNLQPRAFVADTGEEFEVEIIKPTIACFRLKLLRAGKEVNRIKVRKTNPRLRYLIKGELVSPQELTNGNT